MPGDLQLNAFSIMEFKDQIHGGKDHSPMQDDETAREKRAEAEMQGDGTAETDGYLHQWPQAATATKLDPAECATAEET